MLHNSFPCILSQDFVQSKSSMVPRNHPEAQKLYKLHFLKTKSQESCGLDYLVKANQVKLTTYVDPLRTDAKDADPLQTPLRIHNASRHGRR